MKRLITTSQFQNNGPEEYYFKKILYFWSQLIT